MMTVTGEGKKEHHGDAGALRMRIILHEGEDAVKKSFPSSWCKMLPLRKSIMGGRLSYSSHTCLDAVLSSKQRCYSEGEHCESVHDRRTMDAAGPDWSRTGGRRRAFVPACGGGLRGRASHGLAAASSRAPGRARREGKKRGAPEGAPAVRISQGKPGDAYMVEPEAARCILISTFSVRLP